VVCSVLERDVAATWDRLERAPRGCALVEIRADHLRPEEIAAVVGRTERPLVVTVRRREDGGAFDGSEEERRKGLLAALAAGAAWIDVEADRSLADLARGEHASRVIVSRHGVACTVEALRRAHAELKPMPAGRIKIVARAERVDEVAAVRQLLAGQGSERRLACFALGRAGAISRLLAPAWGSWATYGSARRGRETAEGQFPAAELLDVYDVLGIGPSTRCFALVGSRVFGSPSPAMHRAGYRALGIDARYFPIELDTLDPLVELLQPPASLELRALAVTMPFKERAAERCVARDGIAAVSGAANTVLLQADGWHGFNTDGPAALAAASRHLEPAGARVAVLGAGGTARAVAAALAGAGARVTLFNRSAERAREAAERLGVGHAAWTRAGVEGWDLLVNATPLGGDGEYALPVERLLGRVVLDAVYADRPTPLVREARERGLAVIDGVELLAAQAALQCERMTGRRAEAELLERTAREWLAEAAA